MRRWMAAVLALLIVCTSAGAWAQATDTGAETITLNAEDGAQADTADATPMSSTGYRKHGKCGKRGIRLPFVGTMELLIPVNRRKFAAASPMRRSISPCPASGQYWLFVSLTRRLHIKVILVQ